MTAACMNSVRNPARETDPSADQWIRCAWTGEVADLNDECPLCLRSGNLAPVVNVPRRVPS